MSRCYTVPVTALIDPPLSAKRRTGETTHREPAVDPQIGKVNQGGSIRKVVQIIIKFLFEIMAESLQMI